MAGDATGSDPQEKPSAAPGEEGLGGRDQYDPPVIPPLIASMLNRGRSAFKAVEPVGECQLEFDGDSFVFCSICGWKSLVPLDSIPRRACTSDSPRPHGAGYFLLRKLGWLKWLQRDDCQCVQHATQMDRLGVRWCARNAHVIVQWLIDGWVLGELGGDVVRSQARKIVDGCIHEARLDRVAKFLTIAVTTYLRPDSLKRCVDSFGEYWPGVPILVEDTQGNLSAGRNRLVAKTETPFMLVCEDDMEVTEETRLDVLVDVMVQERHLAGCGGLLNSERSRWAHDFDILDGKLVAEPSRRAIRATRDGLTYQPCQLIENFGVFRTDVLREVPWDEDLELCEHREWFWRLSRTTNRLVALSPQCTILHHCDRPTVDYNMARDRSRTFAELAEEKIGYPFHSVTHEYSFGMRPLNVIVFGVGHSNTTITTRQLIAIGWNSGDADDEYAESVSVRDINDAAILTGELDVILARAALENLSEPWVLKDPRFARTLEQWMHLFAPYQPLLLWIQKDLELVKASFVRRGESHGHVDWLYDRCQMGYDVWPWQKMTVRADQVTTAVSMFDITR